MFTLGNDASIISFDSLSKDDAFIISFAFDSFIVQKTTHMRFFFRIRIETACIAKYHLRLYVNILSFRMFNNLIFEELKLFLILKATILLFPFFVYFTHIFTGISLFPVYVFQCRLSF